MMGNLKRITIFYIHHLKVPATKRFNFLTSVTRCLTRFLGFKAISVRVSSTFCQVGLLQRLTSCKLHRRYSDVMCWEQARAVLSTYFCDVIIYLLLSVALAPLLIVCLDRTIHAQLDPRMIRPVDISAST